MTHSTAATPRPRRGVIRARITALLVGAVVAVAACSGDGDSSSAPDNAPAGEYALRTIDRVSLPAQIFRGAGLDPLTGRYYDQVGVVVNEGSINFFAPGKYAMGFTLTRTLNGVVRNIPFTAAGTYEWDRGDIYFEGIEGVEREFYGVLRNGVLSIVVDLSGNGTANQYDFRQ